MHYRPGDKVGAYEVLQLIGRGAHGLVIKVRGGPAGAQFVHALKVLPCDSFAPALPGGAGAGSTARAAAETAREAAFAEARLLQRLRHPHIVSCEDVFWDETRHSVMLVLEFMDGGDMQSLIDERRLEVRQGAGHHFDAHFARRVLAAVGGALAYVHGKGVLHRDVKPGNVLLTRHSQRIKLADFGIAKILAQSGGARTVVGTPYYLSPEIVMGQAYREASDSWALGVMLYEVVALQRPFEAGNQLALVRKICEESPPPLPQWAEPDVQYVVEGLLVKPPEKRLSLGSALRASEAVAALVVDVDAGEASPSSGSTAAVGARPLPASGVSGAAEGSRSSSPDSGRSSDSPSAQAWRDVQTSWCGSEAAAAAREALRGDVDDPEELVRALAALEREREQAQEASLPSESQMSPGALGALESELRLRIAALRDDAAAMLDELLVDGEAEEKAEAYGDDSERRGSDREDDGDAAPLCSSRLSSVCESAHAALEQALEVATSLGVDTDQSEERIARKRGMLSLRVKWGGVARFCMLPVIVGFDSLVAEVSRRFGVTHATSLPQLSWREAGETFSLRSQADWEECLQRRGLVAQPGRLELCVEGDGPPPLPAHPRVRYTSTADIFAGHSPLSHQRPELFTWRVTDRSQFWATRRGPGRLARTGARSPPTCFPPPGSLLAPVTDEEDASAGALKATQARKRTQESLLTASSASFWASSGYSGRPRSSATLASAAPPGTGQRAHAVGSSAASGGAAAARAGAPALAPGAGQATGGGGGGAAAGLLAGTTCSFASVLGGGGGALSSALPTVACSTPAGQPQQPPGVGVGQAGALVQGGAAVARQRPLVQVQVRGRAVPLGERGTAASPQGLGPGPGLGPGGMGPSTSLGGNGAAVGAAARGAAKAHGTLCGPDGGAVLLEVNGRSVPLQ